MTIKVGINGFGRIGRLALRAAIYKAQNQGSCTGSKLPKVVAINDPSMKAEHMAYLLKYDSTHGSFCGSDVCAELNDLIIDGRHIQTYSERDPCKIEWKGVDYVIEASGKFRTGEMAAKHCATGVKRVIITAPAKGVATYVLGVNHEQFNPEKDQIVSLASCTTNCLVPLAKIVHEKFSICEGLVTTVHAVTASQKSQDGVDAKKWRAGRGCMQNIIPTTTGAAEALAQVLPELKGKVTAMAIGVPVADVSLVDLTCKLERPAKLDAIRCCIKEAAEGYMKGILGFTDEQVVSSDIIGDTRSCVFDARASMALNETFVKLIAWYDNEFAYASRVSDMVNYMASREAICC